MHRFSGTGGRGVRRFQGFRVPTSFYSSVPCEGAGERGGLGFRVWWWEGVGLGFRDRGGV